MEQEEEEQGLNQRGDASGLGALGHLASQIRSRRSHGQTLVAGLQLEEVSSDESE